MVQKNGDHNLGKLSEYDPNIEECQIYVERLELYFIANDEEGENKKIAFCRYETYCLFKGPTLPSKPATKRFNELVSSNHEKPKCNPAAKMFRFNR